MTTSPAAAARPVLATPTHRHLPRWRGFNLLELFSLGGGVQPFREDDFRFIADHGFDFVRLPLDYRLLVTEPSAQQRNGPAWDHLEQAAEFGVRHGVHVNVGLHRAPGYCCNPPVEATNLFRDSAPQEQFRWLWHGLAERFARFSPAAVSFNLLNEPPAPACEQSYARLVRAIAADIHALSPARVVIADGLCWGRWGGAGLPSFALADDPVAQSVHCYEPAWLNFHKMNQDPFLNGPPPTWPGRLQVPAEQCAAYPHELFMMGDQEWDKAVLRDYYFGPWRGLQALGVGLHCGELSVFRHTPQATALAYLTDLLEILRAMNCGWAMWNLRGHFGILNADRADADTRPTPLGALDVKMLALLQRY